MVAPPLTTLENRRFKRFPPPSGQILVPLNSRETARSALALYPACSVKAVWFQFLAYQSLNLIGPRALPGRARRWVPPMSSEAWFSLCNRLKETIGDFQDYAICERSQLSRTGIGMLALDEGHPVFFAKLKQSPFPLEKEKQALQALLDTPPTTFSAPSPLGSGSLGGWSYLAMTPIVRGLHSVPTAPP